MTKAVKIAVCIALSFMFSFLTMGYAALTTTLSITGSAEVKIPSGLFITSVTKKSTNGYTDKNVVSYLPYSTTIDSTISKSNSNTAGAVTYTVTVYNNTNYEYAYRGLYYQTTSSVTSTYNGNSLISNSNGNKVIGVIPTIKSGQVIGPKETLTFDVTYTLGSNYSLNRNYDYRTLINYQFGINLDSEEAARDAVIVKFENILNTQSTYETLVDKLDDKYDGSGKHWLANYIGNVTASSSDDSTTVNTLFAGQLQMTVNGVPTPVTVLIKHENLDNNTQTGDDYSVTVGYGTASGEGCEMTLYLTTSKLQSSGTAEVYAAVFTCDKNDDGTLGEWYMIGDLYRGYASVVGYEGGDSTGSFDTGTWRAYAEEYTISDDESNKVVYSTGYGNTIQTIVQATDDNAEAVLSELLTEAKSHIDNPDIAGSAMVTLEQTYRDLAKYYTLDESGNPAVNDGQTRAQLLYAIKELQRALKPFEGI